MSAALATIFSFEKSRKWIIREGLTGISVSGSGAPIASGWKKSLGFLTLLLGVGDGLLEIYSKGVAELFVCARHACVAASYGPAHGEA